LSATNEPISFEQHIKPLFREGDRQSMKWAFDLWSHDEVAPNSDAIMGRLRDGTMPCDGAWSDEQIVPTRPSSRLEAADAVEARSNASRTRRERT
jgi:hypothetical protein